MKSIEVSSPLSPIVRPPSSKTIDIILPGYVENADNAENAKNETRVIRFSKWLLPRFISWGTIAFIIYIVAQNLNVNLNDVKEASSIISNGGVTVSNTTSFTNLAKITELWDSHHLLAYHIIGLSIFGLLTNQEAILGEKMKGNFFCSDGVCMKGISYYGSQILGLVSAGAGMIAIYYNGTADFSEWFSTHLYSPHAWIGATTILTWCTRHITGLMMPSYTRLHTSLSRTAYVMGLASCVLGFQTKQSTDLLALSSNVANMTNATTNTTNVITVINKNAWVSMQSSVASVLIAASGLATAIWMWM